MVDKEKAKPKSKPKRKSSIMSFLTSPLLMLMIQKLSDEDEDAAADANESHETYEIDGDSAEEVKVIRPRFYDALKCKRTPADDDGVAISDITLVKDIPPWHPMYCICLVSI